MIIHQAAAVLVETETSFVMQQRDDIPGIVNPGKVGLFAGEMEDQDDSPLDGAIRELEEETSLRLDRSEYRPVAVVSYRGVDQNREELEHNYHVFSVKIESPDFEVYEGQGSVEVPKDFSIDDFNFSIDARYVLAHYCNRHGKREA